MYACIYVYIYVFVCIIYLYISSLRPHALKWLPFVEIHARARAYTCIYVFICIYIYIYTYMYIYIHSSLRPHALKWLFSKEIYARARANVGLHPQRKGGESDRQRNTAFLRDCGRCCRCCLEQAFMKCAGVHASVPADAFLMLS